MARRPRYLLARCSQTERKGEARASLFILTLIVSYVGVEPVVGQPQVPDMSLSAGPISPIAPPVDLDEARVRVGERLFHDPRLSHENRVACVTCHSFEKAGATHEALTRSPESEEMLDFNIPTIFNAAIRFRYGWLGRFRSIDEQNEFVLLSPSLMNTTWDELLAKLSTDANYIAAFSAIYGGPIERTSVLNSLATYERSLLTPNAPFDRYLRGEAAAITPDEEAGFRLFKTFGCVACHQGQNVGGNLYQRFGIFEPPYPPDWPVRTADLGRFAITGQEQDRYVFRVPSLRNVAVTAPYFHNGSARTLEQAVSVMARKQLGRTLEDKEVQLLVAFLGTLTGEYRGHRLNAPPKDVPP